VARWSAEEDEDEDDEDEEAAIVARALCVF
jgi:hypothetical protein